MSIAVRNTATATAPADANVSDADVNDAAVANGLVDPTSLLKTKTDASAALLSSGPTVAADGVVKVGIGASAATPTIAAYAATAPELPNTEGTHATVSQAAAVATKTEMFNGGASSTVSPADVFNILQQATAQNQALAFKLNLAANNTAINAKKQEVTDLQKQIAGEQKSAITKFAVSIASAAVTAAVPILGAKFSKGGGAADDEVGKKYPTKTTVGDDLNGKPTAPSPSIPTATQSSSLSKAQLDAKAKKDAAVASGAQPPSGGPTVTPPDPLDTKAKGHLKPADYASAMGQPLGQALGDTISKTGDLADKLGGGQHDADMAKVDQKIDTVKSQIAQTAVDSSKAMMDQALGHVKDAQTAIQGFAQRKMEVDNNTAAR